MLRGPQPIFEYLVYNREAKRGIPNSICCSSTYQTCRHSTPRPPHTEGSSLSSASESQTIRTLFFQPFVQRRRSHNHLNSSYCHLGVVVRESLSTSGIYLCPHASTFSTQELLNHNSNPLRWRLAASLGKTPTEMLISQLPSHAYGAQ